MESWIDSIIIFLLVSSALLLALGIVSLFVVHVLKIRGTAKLWIYRILIIMPLVYPIGTLFPNHVKIHIPLEWLQSFYSQAIEPGNTAISEDIIPLIGADKTSFNKYLFTERQTSDSQTFDVAISMPRSKLASLYSINWKLIIAIAWITLFLLILVRLLFTVERTKLLLKCADYVTDPYILALLKQCSAETGVRRIPRLLIVDRMLIPMAVGLLYPTIVIPKKFLEPKFNEGLRFTLLHELKHLKRHDNWWLLIESLVSAAYFFHPVIYWAKQRIHEEWEYICDRHVIQVTNKSASYADFLLHEIWEHGRGMNPSLAVPFILNARKTTKRVYSILEKKRSTLFTKIRDRFAVSIIFVCFISFFLFSVTPSAHIKEDDLKNINIETSDDPGESYIPAIKNPIEESKEGLSINTSIIELKPPQEQKDEKTAEVIQNSVPADPEPAGVITASGSIEATDEYEIKVELKDEDEDTADNLTLNINEIDFSNDAKIPAVYQTENAGMDEMGSQLINSKIAAKNNKAGSWLSVEVASLNVDAEKRPLNPENNNDADTTAYAFTGKGEEYKKEDMPAKEEESETSTGNVRIPKGARIYAWQSIDNKNIIFRTHFYGDFKATFVEDCTKIASENRIEIDAQWPYELDEQSSIILSNGDEYKIQKLVPYTDKKPKYVWNLFF